MTESNEMNPYASPRVRVEKVAQAPTPRGRIEGDCVVIRSGGVLPMRCCATNAECGPADQRVRKFSFAPSFRLVIARRKCRLFYYLCKTRRGYIFWSRVLAVSIFFAGIWLGVGLLALVFAFIIYSGSASDGLKVVKFRDGEFWIKGGHAGFLDSLVAEDGWTRS